VQVDLRGWKAAGIEAELKLEEYGTYISTTIYGTFDRMMRAPAGRVARSRRLPLPGLHAGQPLSSRGVNDPELTELIKLQRRTFDPARRRDIIYDTERHAFTAECATSTIAR